MTDYETVDFTRDGHIGWLRLNRPDKLNSFTIKMWQELRALGKELRDDSDLRALVVVGTGVDAGKVSIFNAGGTQQVIVVDNQPPSLTCPAAVTVNADSGLCSASGVSLGVPASTNDNCGVATVVNNGSEPSNATNRGTAR